MLTRIHLLLLSAFFLSWSAEYHIDLKQCGETTNCFVRESCTEGLNKDKNNLILLTTEKLKNGDCDAIIQIRIYSLTKWHVMMQVNASDSPNDIDPSGVTLSQGEMQFGCRKEGPTVNTALFKIASQEPVSYEKKFVFCSFTLELQQGFQISDAFRVNALFPTLEFTLGTLNSVAFDSEKQIFWDTKPKKYCNPEMVTSVDNTKDNYLQTQIDPFHIFPPYICEEPAFALIYRGNSAPSILQPGETLSCNNAKWTYSSVKIPDGEQFAFTCARKFCSLCAPLKPEIVMSGHAVPTEGKNSDDCVTSTCPDNQWILDDSRTLKGEMECKQEDNERASAWYFNNGSVSEKVKKAACFDKSKACSEFLTSSTSEIKFNDACPLDPDWECQRYNVSTDKTEISCPANFSMRWGPKGQPMKNATKLTCHFLTSQFRDEKSHVVAGGSNVYCTRKKESSPSAAGLQNDWKMVGGIVGACVGVATVVTVAFVLCKKYKPRKKVEIPKVESTAQVKSTASDAPVVVHKKQLKKDNRGPWLKRVRDLPKMRPSNETALGQFDNAIFDKVICEEFHRYSFEHRMTILYNVTAFKTYENMPAKKEEEGEEGGGGVAEPKDPKASYFGNFYQFWKLFYVCEQKQVDCWDTWEIIFRFLRLLRHKMEILEYSNGSNKLIYRFDKRMMQFALPILEDLGWTIRKGEAHSDTRMRFIVVRVLYWVKHRPTMDELKRLSKVMRVEGVEMVEPPIRAVVYRWIVDHGQFETLKKVFWEDALKDVQDDNESVGSFRQHVLFGLASVHGKPKKEILGEMYKFDEYVKNPFTPLDFFWAYLGATEHVEEWDEVVYEFAQHTNQNLKEDTRKKQFEIKHGKRTPEVQAVQKEEWMRVSLDVMYMMLECCQQNEDFKKLIDNDKDEDALKFYKSYCQDLIDRTPDFIPILETRAININLRLEEDGQLGRGGNRKDLIDDFERSFEKIEFDIHARDPNPTIPKMLDKLREKKEEQQENEENMQFKKRNPSKKELEARKEEEKKGEEPKKIEIDPKIVTIDVAAKKIEEKKADDDKKKVEEPKKGEGETMVEVEGAKKSEKKVGGVKKVEEPKKGEGEKKVDVEKKKIEDAKKKEIEESSWPGGEKKDEEEEAVVDLKPGDVGYLPPVTGGRPKAPRR